MPDSAPVYGDLQVKQAPLPAPLQNPDVASPAAFGAPIAQGLDDLAQGLGHANRIRLKEKAKRNETDALDAHNQLVDATNQDLAGYLQKTGKDAIGLADQARTDFQKHTSEISQTLTDPDAKKTFQQLADRRWLEIQRTVTGHAAGQVKEYQAQTYNGTIERTRQDAIDSGDPAQVDKAASLQFVTRQRLGDLLGTDPQTLDLQHRADRSALYGGMVQSMVDDENYQGAKDYFAAHKDDIQVPEVRNHLEKIVNAGDVRSQAQDAATKIFGPDKTIEAMYGEADNIKDQNIQAATKERLRTQFLAHKDAVEQNTRKLYDDSLGLLNQNPTAGLAAVPVTQLTQLNEADPERYRQLAQTAANLAAKQDVTTPMGNAYFMRLRSDLSGVNGDAAKNAAINEHMERYSADWSQADQRTMSELVDKAKNGKDLSTEAGDEKAASEALALNGLKPEPINHDGTPNVEAIALRTWLSKQLATDRASGKKPTPDDVRKTLATAFTPVPDPAGGSTWFGLGSPRTIPAFMLGVDRSNLLTAMTGGTGQYAQNLSDFPDDQVAATRSTFKAAGIVPTDDSVLRFLRAKAATGTAKPAPKSSAPPSYPTLGQGF